MSVRQHVVRPLQHTRQKWYGNSVVRATYRDGHVWCVTPTSAQSGAARRLSVTFGPEHTANMSTIQGVGVTATLRGSSFVLGDISTTYPS